MLLLLFCCCTGQQLFAAQPQQPTYGSWHLPAPRSLCKHNVCLAEFTFTYTSASRAESQPDRKAAGTERSRSLHSVSPAGGKLGKKKKGKRQVGPAKGLLAKKTAHEQSRHFMWRSSTLTPSVLPPRLAGLQRESQRSRGKHLPARYSGHLSLRCADSACLRNHKAWRICCPCFLRNL